MADPLAAKQAADPLAAEQAADPLAAEQTADPLAAVQAADPLAAEQTADPLAAEQTADPLAAAGAALAAHVSLIQLANDYMRAEAGAGPVPLPLGAFVVLIEADNPALCRWAVDRCPAAIPPYLTGSLREVCTTAADTARVVAALAGDPGADVQEIAGLVISATPATDDAYSRVFGCLMALVLLDRKPAGTRATVVLVADYLLTELNGLTDPWIWSGYLSALRGLGVDLGCVAICDLRSFRREVVEELRWHTLPELVEHQTASIGTIVDRMLFDIDRLAKRVARTRMRAGADEFARRRLAVLRRNVAAFVRWRAAVTAGATILRRAEAAAGYAGFGTPQC